MIHGYRTIRRLLPIALILGISLLLGIAAIAVAAAKPYVSLRGYQITPAPGWEINDSGEMGTDVVISASPSDGFAPNLNVVVGPAPAGISLAHARALANQQMSKILAGYKLVSQSYTTVDGVRAINTVIEHSTGAGGRRLHLHQVVAIRGGQIYTFSGTSLASNHAKYDSAFNQMLHSIRWHALHTGG